MRLGGIPLEQDPKPQAQFWSQNRKQLHRHICFVVRFWVVQLCQNQKCPELKAKSQDTGQTSNRLQDIEARGS